MKKENKRKYTKLLISFFTLLVVITLMVKFIPFRGNALPTWDDLLCELPIIAVIGLLVFIFRR